MSATPRADVAVGEVRGRTVVVRGYGRERQRAAELFTQAAYHAFVLAITFGYLHLARLTAQRALDAAGIVERPELKAFAMFARAPSAARAGGRRCAARMLDRALDDAQQWTTIRDGDTLGAEVFGLLHLMVGCGSWTAYVTVPATQPPLGAMLGT